MLKEFRDFAMKGNVVDLAVGVIIGAAFGAIVTSLVGDVIMPIIGAISGGLDFSNYFVPLSAKVTATNLADAKKQGAVLAYGSFLTVSLNFIILALIIFLMIQQINRLKREPEAAPAPAEPPPTPEDIQLLREIRDSLEKLRQLPVVTDRGAQIQLDDVAQIVEIIGRVLDAAHRWDGD